MNLNKISGDSDFHFQSKLSERSNTDIYPDFDNICRAPDGRIVVDMLSPHDSFITYRYFLRIEKLFEFMKTLNLFKKVHIKIVFDKLTFQVRSKFGRKYYMTIENNCLKIFYYTKIKGKLVSHKIDLSSENQFKSRQLKKLNIKKSDESKLDNELLKELLGN